MAGSFSLIRGRRLRITRLDNCGRPVTGVGACSFVVTKGFTEVKLTPEVETGQETTVKNASGELCISDKACDQLKWLQVEVTFCEVDPDLITLLNPDWTQIHDYQGASIGWSETYTQTCSGGFALELWSDVYGSNTCGQAGADGSWGYLLLPWILGASMAEITINEQNVSFQFTGMTKRSAMWGSGPYPVMLWPGVTSDQPVPGPLLTPVGPDESRRIFITSVAPPDAKDGCQSLTPPTGPTVAISEYVAQTNPDPTHCTPKAEISGVTAPVTIDWGDPNAPGYQQITDLSTPPFKSAPYAKPPEGETATFTVRVWPTGNPLAMTTTGVTVPFGQSQDSEPAGTPADQPADPGQATGAAGSATPRGGRKNEPRT